MGIGIYLLLAAAAIGLIAASEGDAPVLQNPRGRRYREFDVVQIGRRGDYEYQVVYTPNDAQRFSAMATGLGNDWSAETIIGGFDTVPAAEMAAIGYIDGLTGRMPTIESGTDGTMVESGTINGLEWQIWYQENAPQPFVVMLGLGTDAAPMVTTATATTLAHAKWAAEKFAAEHAAA